MISCMQVVCADSTGELPVGSASISMGCYPSIHYPKIAGSIVAGFI